MRRGLTSYHRDAGPGRSTLKKRARRPFPITSAWDRPSYVPGITISLPTLIVEHQVLSVFCSITEDAIDSLGDFMGDDIIGYKLSGPPPVAVQMPIEAASDRWVVPHGKGSSLAESAFEIGVALLAAAPPAR